jgi:hypothetical protein
VALRRRLNRSTPGSAVQTYTLSALLPVAFGRLTLLGIAGTKLSRRDAGGFSLGGFLNWYAGMSHGKRVGPPPLHLFLGRPTGRN